jgi:hypothetical protein
MSSDRLANLEAKVKGLIAHTYELKRQNAHMEDRLRRWEREREWLRGRLLKALGELNTIVPERDRESGGS